MEWNECIANTIRKTTFMLYAVWTKKLVVFLSIAESL